MVVNLYPFIETISKEDSSLEEAIENIDIGGPSMVRSAAKNNLYTGVVVEPEDYQTILDEMKENDGSLKPKLGEILQLRHSVIQQIMMLLYRLSE